MRSTGWAGGGSLFKFLPWTGFFLFFVLFCEIDTRALDYTIPSWRPLKGLWIGYGFGFGYTGALWYGMVWCGMVWYGTPASASTRLYLFVWFGLLDCNYFGPAASAAGPAVHIHLCH
jgi:hypothetical protein